jgi:WD40 repeat protein
MDPSSSPAPDLRRRTRSIPSVRKWRVSDGANLWIAPGHVGGTRAVSVSSDNATVYSGGTDARVKFWRAADGVLLNTLVGHTDAVTSLALSPNGQTLASGSYDQTIRLWNASTGAPGITIGGSASAIQSIAWSPNGQSIAAAEDQYGNNVQLFRLRMGRC